MTSVLENVFCIECLSKLDGEENMSLLLVDRIFLEIRKVEECWFYTCEMPLLSNFLSPSVEPDGPPMDVILQPVTSQSIRVTWKVK